MIQYTDYALLRDKDGVYTCEVICNSRESLRESIAEIESEGGLPLNDLGCQIHAALRGWGVDVPDDYNDTLTVEPRERVTFTTAPVAETDRYGLIVVLPAVPVDGSWLAELVQIVGAWLVTNDFGDLEVGVVGRQD